jgi:hypothetical protein
VPEPREFRIIQNAQAALQAIAVASGYHHTVEAVAVKLDPDQKVEDLVGENGKRPFLILEMNQDAFSYEPAMRVNIRMPFTVHAVADSDPLDDASWWRTFFRLCADIEQALAVDISRGQLAIDTKLRSREADASGGHMVWAMVNGDFFVKRSYGAPNA